VPVISSAKVSSVGRSVVGQSCRGRADVRTPCFCRTASSIGDDYRANTMGVPHVHPYTAPAGSFPHQFISATVRGSESGIGRGTGTTGRQSIGEKLMNSSQSSNSGEGRRRSIRPHLEPMSLVHSRAAGYSFSPPAAVTSSAGASAPSPTLQSRLWLPVANCCVVTDCNTHSTNSR